MVVNSTIIQSNSSIKPNSYTPLPLKLIYIQKNTKTSNISLKIFIYLIIFLLIIILTLTHFYMLGYIGKAYKTKSGQILITRAKLPSGGLILVEKLSNNPKEYRKILGASSYLNPGIHDNIVINLDEKINSSDGKSPKSNEPLIIILYKDRDGNKQFNSEKDSPYRSLPLFDFIKYSRIWTQIE